MKEKFEILVDLLKNDKEVGEKLLTMSPEDAVVALKAKGCDFTTEELVELINVTKKAIEKNSGELSENELEDATGGKINLNNATGAGIVLGSAAVGLGYAAIVVVCGW